MTQKIIYSERDLQKINKMKGNILSKINNLQEDEVDLLVLKTYDRYLNILGENRDEIPIYDKNMILQKM